MSGLIGRKLGMVTLFAENGNIIPGTVIEAGPCPVVAVRTKEKNGYEAVQLGFGAIKESRVTKPVMGQFKASGTTPTRLLREFRGAVAGNNVGDVKTVALFAEGEHVKVTGISKGRGFAGSIKRHGFHRPNQSHGTHESFRGTGSIGAHSYPARVFPGKKFPGHMGNAKVTVLNLEVATIDAERNLIVVRGAVPGANGGFVELRKMGGAQ